MLHVYGNYQFPVIVFVDPLSVLIILLVIMAFHGGGVTFAHHNELRDLTAGWLQEVCHDACVEPSLQLLTGESINPGSANCRVDVWAARG